MVAIASIGAKRTFGGSIPAELRRPKKFSESSKRVSLMIGTETDCLDRSLKVRDVEVSS
jgi:hypothetical protein